MRLCRTTTASKLRSLAPGGYLDADDVPRFGTHVSGFDSRLEQGLATNKWMIEPPGKVTGRWAGRGALALFGGILVIVAGANLPASGLVMLGACAIVGGVFSGDLGTALDRAAALCRVVATGRAALTEGDTSARRAAALMETAADLSACAGLWRRDDLD